MKKPRSPLTQLIVLWAPVAIYMVAIFAVSAEPDVSIPLGLSDKSWHLIAYAPLAVLMVRALAGGLPASVSVRLALVGVALTTAYAVTDEFHQSFVPGRSAEMDDLAADAIGACVGAGVCWLWGIISPSWPLKT